MSSEIARIRIEVPEQGFDQTYKLDEIGQFFDGEAAFFNTISSLLQEQVTWENRAFHTQNVHNTATRELREMRRQVESGDSGLLNSYISQARHLQVVIGQGMIGQRIVELLSAGAKNDARWMFYMFSSRWSGGNIDEFLAPIRAAVIGSPMFMGFRDLVSAEHAARMAEEARQQSEATARGFEEFRVTKSKLIEELEELFRKKIPVEEPALVWDKLSAAKTKEWKWWLCAFMVLAIVPVVAALWWWEAIAGAVTRVTTSGSAFSLGGVAAVTVPAVLYLWVLKNLSRTFQQRMALADDAAHRKVLAMTYLGLAKEPTLQITDNDRALILNALFRPVPPHAADDGPPTGLIDLIKGR